MSETTTSDRLPGYVLPFGPEQKEEEARLLREQQEVEQALFRFIVAVACAPQANLGVARALSRYLGQAYPLPAVQILEALAALAGSAEGPPLPQPDTRSGLRPNAFTEPLPETVTVTLALLNVALADTPLELGDPDIEGQSPMDMDADGNNRWISIHLPEVSTEDRMRKLQQSVRRDEADPLLAHAVPRGYKRPSERKMRFASFAGLVAFGLLSIAAAQNYGCAPDLSFLENTFLVTSSPAPASPQEAQTWPPLRFTQPSPRFPANKSHDAHGQPARPEQAEAVDAGP